MAGEDPQPERQEREDAPSDDGWSGDAPGGEGRIGQARPGHEWRSDVVDVSGLSLSELVELTDGQNSALALALRRLADDLADPGEPIAGFNSAL